MSERVDAYQHAIRYAAIGWRVFPLAAGTKVPKAGSAGCADATVDPGQIAAWFSGKGFANLAVATGQESGLVVLDVDGADGAATLLDWEAEGLVVPETVAQRTQSGGRQFFFRHPGDQRIQNSARAIGGGIDIRADGGYVVVPPSRITGGGAYSWLDDPETTELAPCPAWLLDKIRDGRTVSPTVGDTIDLTVAATRFADHPGAPAGERNQEAARLAGCELTRGTSAAETLHDAIAWANRCRPPMPVEELAAVLESISKRETRKEREEPLTIADDDYQPFLLPPDLANGDGWERFPVEALPSPFREFVASAAEALSTDNAMIATPFLAMLAGAIGNTFLVRLGDEWTEPPALWSMLVAESGSLKSPSIERTTRFAANIDADLAERNRVAKEQYRRDLTIYEASLAEWKRSNRSPDGTSEPPPVEPPQPPELSLSTCDTTVEAMAKLLHDNPRGVLVVCDELSGWFGSFDRYGSGGAGGGDASRWLSMFNGLRWKIHRKTSGSVEVERGLVSIAGGIQPAILAKSVGTEHLANGLLPRFLLAAPPRTLRKRSRKGIDPIVAQSVADAISTLFNTPVGDGGPVEIDLDAEADLVFDAWFEANAVALKTMRGAAAAMASKSEAIAVRIALVLHLAEAAASPRGLVPGRIGRSSMEAGVTLARWYAREWLRIFGITVADNGLDDDAKALLAIIHEAGGEIRDRDVRDRSRRLKDSAARGAAVARLVAAGRITTETRSDDRRGPPPLWLILVSSGDRPHVPGPQVSRKPEEYRNSGTGDAGTGFSASPDAPSPTPTASGETSTAPSAFLRSPTAGEPEADHNSTATDLPAGWIRRVF